VCKGRPSANLSTAWPKITMFGCPSCTELSNLGCPLKNKLIRCQLAAWIGKSNFVVSFPMLHAEAMDSIRTRTRQRVVEAPQWKTTNRCFTRDGPNLSVSSVWQELVVSIAEETRLELINPKGEVTMATPWLQTRKENRIVATQHTHTTSQTAHM